MAMILPKLSQLVCILVHLSILFNHHLTEAQSPANNRRNAPINRRGDRPPIMKDTFFEDNSFVVRIRTTYNYTSSITCNAVVMEDRLVISDVSCIKYQGMANIDARFVHVIAGETTNESVYEVDQIFINKANPKDPSTELAILRLTRPLKPETRCKELIKPDQEHYIDVDSPVRVIGFTQNYELKENRTKIAKKNLTTKYLCTSPSDLDGTPGSQLLKGAPLLQLVDCKRFQLVGILTRLDVVNEPTFSMRKHQDCFVMVSSLIKWFDQVKSLIDLAAKNEGPSTQSSVVLVESDEPANLTSTTVTS